MADLRALPEQPEAKRLLDAALAEGPAHAYLFHGPPGVGKRDAALAFAGELLGDRAARRAARHPDLYVLEALGDDDPDRRRPRAPARPAHAPVRGRPARLPHLRRAPAERGRGRRAAQGSRGAAALRRDRARRRRARAAAGDDPLALPARAVPAAVRAGGARVVDARAPGLSPSEATALARVAAGRLDRRRRGCSTRGGRGAAGGCSRSPAAVYARPGVRAAAAAAAVSSRRRARAARGQRRSEEATRRARADGA